MAVFRNLLIMLLILSCGKRIEHPCEGQPFVGTYGDHVWPIDLVIKNDCTITHNRCLGRYIINDFINYDGFTEMTINAVEGICLNIGKNTCTIYHDFYKDTVIFDCEGYIEEYKRDE